MVAAVHAKITDHKVTFPTKRRRPPYIYQRHLSNNDIEQIRRMDTVTVVDGHRVRPIAWLITTRVKIKGVFRRTLVGERRRTARKSTGSTSTFMVGHELVGQVRSFLQVYIESCCDDSTITTHQLAIVDLYPVHYDDASRMSYCNIHEGASTFIDVRRIGDVVIFAAYNQTLHDTLRADNMPLDLYRRRYLIRARTGLSPSQSSRLLP